jgi:hypothetical protein
MTIVVGLWITNGQNFSTTLKRSPGLAPGPTDKCYDVASMENMTLASTTIMTNVTWTDYYHMETTTEILSPAADQGPYVLNVRAVEF